MFNKSLKKSVALATLSTFLLSWVSLTNAMVDENDSETGSEMNINVNYWKINASYKEMNQNKQEIKQNVQWFKQKEWNLYHFFRTDLTEDEKTLLRDIQNNHMKAIKEISTIIWVTNDEKVAKIKALQEQHINDLLPFVISWKETAFKEWLQWKHNVMEQNNTIKKENKEIKNDIKDIKKDMKEVKKEVKQENKKFRILTSATLNNLNKKLDSLPEDKKEALFTTLISRIDTLISWTDNATKKAILEDLKLVISEKLKALQTNNIQIDILNEVLSDIN